VKNPLSSKFSQFENLSRPNADTLPARGQCVDERGGGSLARRRYQVGSLILRGDNWIGRWREDVITADGVVSRIRRSQVIGSRAELSTKKLARRRLESILARINAPGYRAGRVATLTEFVRRWREDVLAQRKPSTIRAAESHLQRHIVPRLGTKNLDEIGAETVQAFISSLSRGHSRKTVLNITGTLSAILNTAKQWGYVCEGMSLRNLALPSQREQETARYFTAEQARAIIDRAPEPFSTAFAIAAMTGIRPGELFGLKYDDIDFGRKLLFIRRSAWYGKLQAPKSQASIRALPLPEPLETRLRSYFQVWRPNPERLLFATRRGRPLSANNVVQRKLWPILDGLGIPRCGLHAFRHTHSSLLLEVGAPATVAQAQLGHSDPRITLGVYSHVIGDSQRQSVERVAQKLCSKLDLSGPTEEANEEWIH
jgi:integrase